MMLARLFAKAMNVPGATTALFLALVVTLSCSNLADASSSLAGDGQLTGGVRS